MTESAPLIASPSLPERPRSLSLGEPHPANDPGNNLSLRLASSTGSAENKGGARGNGGGSGSTRQRRRKRLTDKGKRMNAAAARLSPPTISEHQSVDHSDSADVTGETTATAETTMMSAGSPETMSPDENVRVRRVPSTPPRENSLFAVEGGASQLLPQSILTITQTFPPPDSRGRDGSSHVPARPTVPLNSTPRMKPQLEPLLSCSAPRFKQRRRPSQSLWTETHNGHNGKDCTTITAQQQKQMKISRNNIPMSSLPVLSPRPSAPGKVLASRPKPKLKKHSTAPSSTVTKKTNVVDDVLMDRAFIIRQNLMNFEMQELAAEAERAAESGQERFVGSTSRFGAEETPPHENKFAGGHDGDGAGSAGGEDLVLGCSRGDGSGLLMTPLRRRSFGINALNYPMEYTPSYFSRKKIPVTALRCFSEVIPTFSDMHNNIRLHLGREGVDLNVLPQLHSRRSLIKNDTDETEKEDGEDLLSQAPSIAGESISSFSSYAVASLASLKEIIEFVNRPRSPAESTSRTTSSMSNANHHSVPKSVEQPGSTRSISRDTVDSAPDRKMSANPSLLPPPSTNFKHAVTPADSDSDDSSVEFYGRRSPVDFSNQSVSSNLSEKMSQYKSSLSQTRSILSAPANIHQTVLSPLPHGNVHQPVLHPPQRRRKNTSGASVSFETEKANYQALLDRMHHHHLSPSFSFEVDQTSCAQSLTNLDIDILPSSPSATSTNRSTPMAAFLSKLGTTFSRGTNADGHKKSAAEVAKDNQHFVLNYFYTSQAYEAAKRNDTPTLKLNINPEKQKDPYCLPGCGPENLLSTCDTATKYLDKVFALFKLSRGEQSKMTSAIIDPKTVEAALHPKWAKPWQRPDGSESSCLRNYTPPKLSLRHTEKHQDDFFCSNSGKVGKGECDESMACPEVREPVTCPEIQKNVGCSP